MSLGRTAYDTETRGLMMSTMSPLTRFAVKLYFRCAMFKEIALPEEGGVLDQSEILVSMLETVHNNVMLEREKMTKSAIEPTKSQNIPGIDPKMIESISIGTQYKRRIRH